ncbi:hypothetical protein [Streptomyces klenkii]|uniref:hypothetical protein n=1 Tax=Streptomyces klenkii TaxID=1420899 RepID=UPI0034274F1F
MRHASELAALETLARRAAVVRARTGHAHAVRPAPGVHLAESEAAGIANVLRHRLGLSRHVPVTVARDLHHPLLPGSTRLRAGRLQLADGCARRRGRVFLAAYDAHAQLVLSVVGRCAGCGSPVPTMRIDALEDFGDWLLGHPGQKVSPLFAASPLHTSACSRTH